MTKAFPTSTLNSEPDRDDEVVKRFQRVHYWPRLCENAAAATRRKVGVRDLRTDQTRIASIRD